MLPLLGLLLLVSAVLFTLLARDFHPGHPYAYRPTLRRPTIPARTPRPPAYRPRHRARRRLPNYPRT